MQRDLHPDSDDPAAWIELFIQQRPDGSLEHFDEWAEGQPALVGKSALIAAAKDLLLELNQAAEQLPDLLQDTEGFSVFRRPAGARPNPLDLGSIESLKPGGRIGSFVLTRFIAQGGMGQVWEAQDRELRRKVALKIVRPDRFHERSLALFAREARAGGRLSHPSLVTTFGFGTDDGVSWIAQELVEGSWTVKDTLDAIRAEETVPEGYYKQVAELIAKIADGMHAAHEAGVIHRDLKPQNILLTPEDQPKVTDFGLARVSDDSFLSNTGEIGGTWAYMSPEQVTAKRMGLDYRTDMFSLGVVLYELLTLRRPFEGDTTHQIAAQIISVDPPDPSKVRSQCPRDLAVICGKALEKSPDRRYQSMLELAEDLRRHLAREPIQARPPSQLRKLQLWALRNPTLSIAAAVSGVALVIILSLLFEYMRVSEDRGAALLTSRHRESIARDAFDAMVGEVRTRLERLPGEEARETRASLLRSALDGLVELESAQTEYSPTLLTAETHKQIGRLALEVSEPHVAAEAFAKSIGICEELQPDESGSTDTRLCLAGALLGLAEAQETSQNREQGLVSIRACIERCTEMALNGEALDRVRYLKGRALLIEGNIHYNAFDYRAAEESLQVATELLRPSYSDSRDADTRRELVRALVGLASCRLAMREDIGDAVNEAQGIMSESLDGAEGDWRDVQLSAEVWAQQGQVSARSLKVNDAAASYERSEAQWRELLDGDPRSRELREGLSKVLILRGIILRKGLQLDAARDALAEGTEILQALCEETGSSALVIRLARGLQELARTQEMLGQPVESGETARRSIASIERQLSLTPDADLLKRSLVNALLTGVTTSEESGLDFLARARAQLDELGESFGDAEWLSSLELRYLERSVEWRINYGNSESAALAYDDLIAELRRRLDSRPDDMFLKAQLRAAESEQNKLRK